MWIWLPLYLNIKKKNYFCTISENIIYFQKKKNVKPNDILSFRPRNMCSY